MSWYYGGFEKRSTIRTDKGIKARTTRAKGDAQPWWSARWIQALESVMNPGRLSRGRSYARAGQVLTVTETPKGVTATVQGSRRAPYKIQMSLTHLTDAQWDAVATALAAEARFAAQLLAGAMPPDVDEAFEHAGARLFPGPGKDLVASCNCPDWADVCKHIAAVHYVVAERFDGDPFLLFRLRGRTEAQMLAALRAHGGGADGAGEAAGTMADTTLGAEPTAPAPLGDDLDAFWRMPAPLEAFRTHVAAPTVRHPVLQRLGPPAFTDSDLAARLGALYDAVTRAVLAEDGEPPPGRA